MNITPLHSHLSTPNSQGQGAQQQSSPSLARETNEQREIEKLQQRDREVRAHEQAHIAAAGGLAKGGATFSFQPGPDGKLYAVGGEVNIDTSPVSGNPDATIRKAKQIRAAAQAPANPSAQDRAVAASASALEAQAQQELQQDEQKASTSQKGPSTSSILSHIDIFV